MSPKKILFVDHAQSVGGAENSLHLLITHLDHKKWQPHLATADGRFAQLTQESQIPTHIIDFPRLRHSVSIANDWRSTAQQLTQLATSINAQVLHANTIRAALYTALAAKMAHLPFIWHMRDFWLSENKPRRLWIDTWGKQLILSASTAVITNSNETARHLPSSPKIHAVHNGIDLTKFNLNLDPISFRAQYQISPDAPIVGMVGRLRPWKGQVHFLKMAAQVAKSHATAYFLVVGGAIFGVDESYPQHLKMLAQELGIVEKIIFTGQINEIPKALAAMDIFVHPGEPEPFGLVNIEAMAMAKPIIAFNHGALPEIVENGNTGILVQSYDIDALATAVTTLINDPQTQKTMGHNGRKRAENHFTIQQTADQITAIYDQITNI